MTKPRHRDITNYQVTQLFTQLNRIEQGLNRLLQAEGLATTGHNEG